MNFSSLVRRRGLTLAGISSLALSCLVFLCGAGTVPVENLLPQGAMQGDLNAGGHSLTNAATVSATNVAAAQITLGGVAMTNWPSGGGGGSTNYDALGAAATAQTFATNYASANFAPISGSTNYIATSKIGAVSGVAPTINPNPKGITLCVAGASISQGYALATGNARYDENFGYQLSQLPFFKGKLITYTTSGTVSNSSGGAATGATLTVASATGIAVGQYVTGSGGTGTIPSGTIVSFVNGTAITIVSPYPGGMVNGTISTATFTNIINTGVAGAGTSTGSGSPVTAVGNWTGSTQTITLTTSPTPALGISGSIAVSGTNIPTGTYGTVSGTTLTLSQPTTGSGSGVTITLAGNNMTDRYAAFIKPHRPATNGGDGGAVSYLLVGGDTVINDAQALSTSSGIISALSSYISTAQADGFTVILCSTTPFQPTGWTASMEIIRQAVNASEYSQTIGVFGANLIFADLAKQICDVNNVRVSYFYTGDHIHWLLAGHTAAAYYLNGVLASGMSAPDLTSSVLYYPYFPYGASVGSNGIAFNPNVYDWTFSNAYITKAGDWEGTGSVYAGYNTGTAAQLQVGSTSAIGFSAPGTSAGPSSTQGALFNQKTIGLGEFDYQRAGSFASMYFSNIYAGISQVAPTLSTGGTSGSTTYKYVLVGYDAAGNSIGASPVATVTTGNATLSSSNYMALSIPGSTTGTGYYTCDIYRTASGGTPSSTGKIGTGFRVYNGANTFYDNGLTADGTTPPTNNATGTVAANQLNLASSQTTVSASTSGSVAFSEPLQGTSLKMVVAYCNNSTGTASFTFPTAFTTTPVVLSASGPAASVVTSVSASAITITGSGTTGPLVLIGY